MSRLSFLSLFLLIGTFSSAQDKSSNLIHTGNSKKGQIFVTWGYNRAYYNKSDVHFKGEGYDFTLFNVDAKDMPEKFGKVYFQPRYFTVPQFNFRAGYYFGENTAISMGWDHMKYHIIQTQSVFLDGYIDPNKYNAPNYTGTYNYSPFLYEPRFMDFHHSDGFNFIRAAIEQRIPFYQSASGNHVFAMNASASLGALLPWTDFTFLGTNHRNRLHFAGYGASVHAGFRYEFFKYFFLQVAAQVGWSNLPDIMLEDELPSRASQKIVFIERSWALGGYIPLKKQKKEKE